MRQLQNLGINLARSAQSAQSLMGNGNFVDFADFVRDKNGVLQLLLMTNHPIRATKPRTDWISENAIQTCARYFFAFFAAGFFAAGFFATGFLTAFAGFLAAGFATTFAALAAGFLAAALTAAFFTATGFAAAFVLGAGFFAAGFFTAGFALFLVAILNDSFLEFRYTDILPYSPTAINGQSAQISKKRLFFAFETACTVCADSLAAHFAPLRGKDMPVYALPNLFMPSDFIGKF